ncbi:Pimeloyl-ACP methyl ester carboxylesterase [Aquiflexum balticum DSM 16537]|uniref:Pimeloyl-ACP methyl ester carboxylesterase n=1 Tax=Aquiflexum balticum DSM 16537 TaxID=758820 RepID=A0A1W2H8H6_9BACT|nr:alpha/beta hydrolase [Aquiflexum balticum]SMD45181.1 Pimeloyl-ACP methyl ester carboxylesterase [Aquiflexum balticum DSM 16537]
MKTQKFNWLLVGMLLAFLKTINASAEPQLITTQIIGKGQPIILVHGMSCSSDVWDELVERYQGKYELHLVTIKGFGNKEMADVDFYLKQVKDELIAYTQEKKLKNPIIIGHSMGGFLGLWAAAEEPEVFEKVISVDGVPYFPVLQMPGITPETAKPMVESMKNAMVNMDEASALANQKMIVSSMIATEEKRAKVIEMGMNSNSAVVGQAYGEMYTTDIRPLMSNIKVPVLVFGSWAAYQNFGATKESVTLGYQNQLKEIKEVKLLVAEKAFHFVFYDEADWFYSEMEKFLND